MQVLLANDSTENVHRGSEFKSNRTRLDLDWIGQQSIFELAGRRPELLTALAAAREEAGDRDPFGDATFGLDTPVVVVLRALGRVAATG